MTTKTKVILEVTATLVLLFLALWAIGCSTSKVILPDGTVILHQPVFLKTTAAVVDFYYESEDPNGVSYLVWLVVNDPNRSVNPGQLTIIEPRTGINATVTAE